MSKLLLKIKGTYPYIDVLKIEKQLLKDLENNGFAIIDDRFDVYEIDDSKGADE